MNEILRLILELALYLNLAFIISVSGLCVLLYYRSRDKVLGHFIRMLTPQILLFLVMFLSVYIEATGRVRLFPVSAWEGLSLYSALFLCFLLVAVLFFSIQFLIYLIAPVPKYYRLAKRLSRILTILFGFVAVYVVIFLSVGDWASMYKTVVNVLFPIASLALAVPGTVGLIYLKKVETKGQRRMIIQLAYSFMPLLLYVPLDILFLKASPFKLSMLSYTVFAVSLTYNVGQYYFLRYRKGPPSSRERLDILCRDNRISQREKEILILLVQGMRTKEIAEKLFISPNTVKSHVKNIFSKLGVSSRIRLVSLVNGESEPSKGRNPFVE